MTCTCRLSAGQTGRRRTDRGLLPETIAATACPGPGTGPPRRRQDHRGGPAGDQTPPLRRGLQATPNAPQAAGRTPEDHRERLCNPARTAQPRQPPLRTVTTGPANKPRTTWRGTTPCGRALMVPAARQRSACGASRGEREMAQQRRVAPDLAVFQAELVLADPEASSTGHLRPTRHEAHPSLCWHGGSGPQGDRDLERIRRPPADRQRAPRRTRQHRLVVSDGRTTPAAPDIPSFGLCQRPVCCWPCERLRLSF
jgi:hypothetical protein